jgi:hypothetical protein
VKTVVWTENDSWDELLSQAGQEDVLVLRDGHPMVLMTPFRDDDLDWYTREYDPGFLDAVAEARRQAELGKMGSPGEPGSLAAGQTCASPEFLGSAE